MPSTDCAKQTQRIEGSQHTHTHTQQEMDETQLDRGQRLVQADTFLFFFYIESIELFWPGSLHFFFFGRPILWLRTNTHTMAKSDGEKRKKRKIDASNTAIHQNARDVVCRAVFHLCVCLLLSYPFGCSKNAFLFFFLSSPSIHPSLSFCVCVCFIYRQRSLTGLYASFYRNSCTDTANTSKNKTKSKRIFLWPLRANRQHEKTITISKKQTNKTKNDKRILFCLKSEE